MKDELIYDKGKLRFCEHNFIILGIWKTAWEFCGYRIQITDILGTLRRSFLEATTFFYNLLVLPLMIVLFPIYPLITAYFLVSDAKKRKKV